MTNAEKLVNKQIKKRERERERERERKTKMKKCKKVQTTIINIFTYTFL